MDLLDYEFWEEDILASKALDIGKKVEVAMLNMKQKKKYWKARYISWFADGVQYFIPVADIIFKLELQWIATLSDVTKKELKEYANKLDVLESMIEENGKMWTRSLRNKH